MEPIEHRIKELFNKYVQGTLTAVELDEFLRYFWDDENEDIFKELMQSNFDSTAPEGFPQERIDRIAHNVDDVVLNHVYPEKQRFPLYRWFSIAAAAIAVLIGSFLFFNKDKEKPMQVAETIEDVDPGTNRATLTLEKGGSIALSEDKTGITIGKDGILYEDGTKIAENDQVQYAVLSTPRKGQYQAILPDGTKVWLNAESSLRYLTAFTGSERRVEVKGEAYFEVVHNAEQPFIVETASQQVKVLGTEFNINSYDNEPSTVTTLITGSVELIRKKDKTIKKLKPEQQASLGADNFTVSAVDIRPFVAWKEGEFRFKDTPLHEALRQIERWYDVKIDYTKIPEDIEIYTYIRRDKKLSSVLFALEKITNLKFTVKERRLMLME